MKTRTIFPLILATAAYSTALGAEPVYTEAVGFVKLGNTEGGATPAVAANTDVHLAIPLEKEAEFSGTVSSTSATTITVSGTPGWAADLWTPATGEPYSVVITSGPENGIRAMIDSHDSDTLTVTATTPGDLSNVGVGDSLVIRKCWTLKEFTSDVSIPDGTELLLWSETLTGINQVSSSSYVFGGNNWFNQSDFSDANNVVLYPGETFVLRSGATEIDQLTLFGDVPTSALRNLLHKDGTGEEDLFIAAMGPVPSLVSALNIPVADGDQLLKFEPTSTGINSPATASYVYGGGTWFDQSDFSDVSASLTVQPGEGFILRRASASPATEEWTEPAP